jgi:adenylosuccinate lyase
MVVRAICGSEINVFEPYYAPRHIRDIFDERAVVESWLMFEGLLAEVQGELGIIPQAAAREIKAKATLEHVQFERIVQLYSESRHAGLATVRALADVCEHGAGEYVHYGASAPELWENTLALRLGRTMDIIEGELGAIRLCLHRLADVHRHTVMVERSLGKQALPTTFGFVAAVWSDAITKHIQRFQEGRKRILMGFLKGVVGTYASHYHLGGERCLELEKRMLDRLGLYPNDISFRRHLERLAEFMNLLALLAVTFEKIFDDIFFQQRDEIGELGEPFGLHGPSESSTLPQKRNPVLCQAILARCKKIRSNAAGFAEVHVRQSHDTIAFSMENLLIPETCILTGDMLHDAKYVLANLHVYPEGMRRNVELSNGFIMAEGLALTLAKRTGKKQMAHAMIHDAVMKAVQLGVPFKDYLLGHEAIQQYLSREEILEQLKPENYLGLINRCIDRIIQG